jgi:chromosome partitioning protein
MRSLDLLQKLWQSLASIAGKELGAILAATIIALVCEICRRIIKSARSIIDYHRRLRRIQRDIGRENRREWAKEGKGLWLAEPINPPEIRMNPGHSPKVLVVANAKGGVGKTTVAANVAARLADLASKSREKPILLIDLDFQGTLSAMAIYGEPSAPSEDDPDSDATYLISGDFAPERIARTEKCASYIRLTQNPHAPDVRTHNWLRLITSHYDLAQAESRVMVEWLIGDRVDDIRFRLRELLWSDQVASNFSTVIIDCPPRFTTGAIQAFAAATHVLIPTKLDYASREAVVTFARQLELLRTAGICWRKLKHIGVVATMVSPVSNVEHLRIELDDKLALPFNQGGVDGKTRCIGSATDVHENVIFRDAGGKGIAYFLMGDGQRTARVKSAIQVLAHHVAREMNLPQSLQRYPLDEDFSAARMAV